jgi:hypothetical protein
MQMSAPLKSNQQRKFPWRRSLLIGLSGLLSYLLIPLGFSNYNEIRSLRDARLTRAVRFANQNAEFNSKVNATATLLRMTANHNDRMSLSDSQLREAQRDLYKNYQERRLELDASVWWWPSEFAREAGALDLLSADEMQKLNTDVEEYKKSVLATMNQLTYLWRFLDSPEYSLNDQSKKKRGEIEQAMEKEFGRQYDIRNGLVSKISQLFIKSNYRTTKLNLLGL